MLRSSSELTVTHNFIHRELFIKMYLATQASYFGIQFFNPHTVEIKPDRPKEKVNNDIAMCDVVARRLNHVASGVRIRGMNPSKRHHSFKQIYSIANTLHPEHWLRQTRFLISSLLYHTPLPHFTLSYPTELHCDTVAPYLNQLPIHASWWVISLFVLKFCSSYKC